MVKKKQEKVLERSEDVVLRRGKTVLRRITELLANGTRIIYHTLQKGEDEPERVKLSVGRAHIEQVGQMTLFEEADAWKKMS